MHQYWAIISNTPLWVWSLFVFLAYIGVNATFKRTRALPSLFVLPIVFMCFKIKNIPSTQLTMLFSGITIGIIVGWLSALYTPIKIIKEWRAVEIPGSYTPLVLMMLFFAFKYYFAVVQSRCGCLDQYLWLDSFLSGLVPGYFLGRSLVYTWRFFYDRS